MNKYTKYPGFEGGKQFLLNILIVGYPIEYDKLMMTNY